MLISYKGVIMNRLLFLVGIFLLLTNCTQNFVSYIKTPSTTSLISLDDILLEVGMVNPANIAPKESVANTIYPTGTLAGKRQILQQSFHTKQVVKNSSFTVTNDTKNYLFASPYYSSPGIIYQADQSFPKQGELIFTILEQSGQIKIRLYSPEGILQSEETWFIEVTDEN